LLFEQVSALRKTHIVQLQAAVFLRWQKHCCLQLNNLEFCTTFHHIEPVLLLKSLVGLSLMCSLIPHAGNGWHLATSVFFLAFLACHMCLQSHTEDDFVIKRKQP